MRSCAQRRRLCALIDQSHGQNFDLVLDSVTRLNIRYCRLERVAEMGEPPFSERVGDGQQIVAMLERQVRVIAVAGIAAEPLGEEVLLRLALAGKIAAEERPQRSVGFDAVVQRVDERCNRATAADASKEIAADERVVRLGVGKESTVLHRALASIR